MTLFPDAARVVEALARSPRRTVATAESCTGGLCAAALTAVPGSSRVVLGGVVAYADAVKTELLGVSRHLLRTEGAVSEAVALAMAEGVRARLGAAVGVGITGVAGPEASERKPAGLIYLGVVDGQASRVVRLADDLGRHGNRVAAVRAALRLLLEAAGSEP
ncbi:MAG TPA: nicotinamide-nucleotide amidohydrolase family protein [Candidatus Dormibacteraeota bacterium]|nr:nicotinamide-nucleotide amidohydrolase family protein [Candidatus Dormibacteraeota bacterium]